MIITNPIHTSPVLEITNSKKKKENLLVTDVQVVDEKIPWRSALKSIKKDRSTLYSRWFSLF